jgi:hypothetical protein
MKSKSVMNFPAPATGPRCLSGAFSSQVHLSEFTCKFTCVFTCKPTRSLSAKNRLPLFPRAL